MATTTTTTAMEKILSMMEQDNIQLDSFVERCRLLHKAYSAANSKDIVWANQLDFSDRLLRTAYIYTYFTAHLYGTRDLWCEICGINESVKAKVQALIRNPKIQICSIGGGPGIDILGTSLFLKSKNFEGTIQGSVLEYYLDWQSDAWLFLNKYKAEGQSNVTTMNYYKFDFRQQQIDTDSRREIERADVVTLIKFISAMAFDGGDYLGKIGELLKYMKRNALLFIMDNSGGVSNYHLLCLLKKAGFDEYYPIQQTVTSVPDQEKEVMHNHDSATVNYNPYDTVHSQESLNVFATVWVKNSESGSGTIP